MGLDMYLERMPRYRNATAYDVNAVEHYLDWKRSKADGFEYANCTFKEWSGYDKIPAKGYISFYSKFYEKKYGDWDVEKKYPCYRISEQVGYWRKANQIHNWFVENVQDGVDDCRYHNEVTQEALEELLDVCQRVLDGCKLVNGKIKNEATMEDGQWVSNMEEGQYVEDPTIAEELLPSTHRFFFGSTDYDEYYVRDIENTIDIVTKVLETTDFDTQMIYYVSSW